MSRFSADSRILVIGFKPQGLQAALTLARCGTRVTLVGGDRELAKTPAHWSAGAKRRHRDLVAQVAYHPSIRIQTETEVGTITGRENALEVELIQKPQWVLPTACVDCRKCLDVCPVALPDGGKPIFEISTPTSAYIDKRKAAPCRSECPLGMNVQGYVALIAQGKFEEAWGLIGETNPLPGVCGRVCHHPCETVCRRGEIDEPIAICSLKRFVADRAGNDGGIQVRKSEASPEGRRVAIIGSGPAGLTAAHDLAKAGFQPTIFEADSVPGGLLRRGIANYRLPRDILEEEIDRILSLGVGLRLNSPTEAWEDIDRLKAEGYHDVVLATGAAKDLHMEIPGEDLTGIYGCVAYLRNLWDGRKPESLGKVIVIGGGNAAVEAARASVRAGARSVTILYRRSQKEMPADPHEVEQALEEGIALRCLTLPIGFEGKDDRLTRIRCLKIELGKPDASGRPRPIPVTGSDHLVPADTAIVSIGQGADPVYATDGNVELTRWGTIRVSNGACTNIPGVFASGDVVSGPSTVVEAMASGRRAAQAIIDAASIGDDPRTRESEDLGEAYEPLPKDISPVARRPIPHRRVSERTGDYEEVIGSLSKADAIEEASRCLQCGVCSECLQCEAACELGVIRHNRSVSRRSEIFAGIIDAENTQRPGILEHARFVRMPHGKSSSLRKAATEGRLSAMGLIGRVRHEAPLPFVKNPLGEGALRAGVFLCSCNETLNDSGALDDVAAMLGGTADVVHTEILVSACHPDKGRRIEEAISEKRLNGVLIASCACCHLDFVCESCTDQRIRLKHRLFIEAGYAPGDIALVNTKESCLLPYQKDPRAGADLAMRAIQSGLWQLRQNKDFTSSGKDKHARILVLGASDAGLAAAKALSDGGQPVVVVDDHRVDKGAREELEHRGIDLISPVKPVRLEGQRGGFALFVEKAESAAARGHSPDNQEPALGRGAIMSVRSAASVDGHDGERSIQAGTIILGRDDFRGMPYKRDPFVGEVRMRIGKPIGTLETNVPGVYMAAWSQTGGLPQEALGKAAAAEALEGTLGGTHPSGDFVAFVNAEMCRGCGSCADICPEGAARLESTARGVACAWVEPERCTACGSCLAECPTGAIRLPESDQGHLERVMDALLG